MADHGLVHNRICRPEAELSESASRRRLRYFRFSSRSNSNFVSAMIMPLLKSDNTAHFLYRASGVVAKLLCKYSAFSREVFFPDGRCSAHKRYFHMISDFSLCGRSVDWLRKFIESFNPSGSSMPHTFPVF